VEDEDADEEDLGLVILKSITENGEELLSTCDSEEELKSMILQSLKAMKFIGLA